jgi:hypothetical protein
MNWNFTPIQSGKNPGPKKNGYGISKMSLNEVQYYKKAIKEIGQTDRSSSS